MNAPAAGKSIETIAHEQCMTAIGTAFRILDVHAEPLRALVDAARHIESAGILGDLNLMRDYVNNKNHVQTQVAMAAESLRFLGEMRKLIAKLPEEPAA